MPLKIVSSTNNLSPRAAATWTARQHREYLRATGYDGTTYYPLDNVLAAQIAAGVEVGDIIAAMQQPWRERNRLQVMGDLVGKVVHDPRPRQVAAAGFDAVMNTAMPHLDRGLKVLNRVQRHIGTESLRPIIVHPWGQMFGDTLQDPSKQPRPRRDYNRARVNTQLGEFQWQPTVELAKHRGVLTRNAERLVTDMMGIATVDGLGRVAFDANHAQAERRGLRFADPVDLAAEFARAGVMGSFEFSLQPHLGGDIEDLRKIVGGNIDDTPQGRMLAAAAVNIPAGQDDFMLRVEIPDYALSELGYEDHVAVHRDLVTALGSFTGDFMRA